MSQFNNQAAVDLTGGSPILSTLKGSLFAGFDGRYVTIAGDTSNPSPTGGDGVVPVNSVRLDEPGSTNTIPANYEHITFQGPSGADHGELHCRANDATLKGQFTAITSSQGRVIPLASNNEIYAARGIRHR